MDDAHRPHPSSSARSPATAGDAGMRRLVLETDWSSTPLGPPDRWPRSLKTALEICLGSRFPMFIWWGPQLINLYNDAYAPILGRRHPEALGKPARELWAEVWPSIGGQIDAVLTRGEASWSEQARLVVERSGYPEEAYFTWSHSPLPDDDGRIGGLICVVSEETSRLKLQQERDRLGAALYASEERYRSFIRLSSEGIWRFELDEPLDTSLPEDEQVARMFRHAYLAECNDAMARMYGFASASELVGRRLTDFQPPSDPANVEFLRAFVRSGYRLDNAESSERDRHGDVRIFLNSLVGVVEDGKVFRAWGNQRDVTEVRRADEQAHRILESITDAFFALDREWRFTYVNRQAERVLDVAHGELLGKVIWDAYPGLRGSAFETSYRRVAQVRMAESVTSFYADHDRWYEVNVYPAPDGGISVYFREVTPHKRREIESRRQSARMAEILESIRDAFYAVDADHRFTYVNRKAEELWGRRREELIGRHYWTEFPQAVGKLSYHMHRKVMAERKPAQYETVSPITGRWVEVSLYPEASGGLSCYFRDISNRKAAEERLRRNHDTFFHLIQNNPFGIYVVDADFKLRQVSLGSRKVFENVRPLIGRDFAEVLRVIWPEPFAGQAIALFRHTLETGEPYSAPSTVEKRADIGEVEAYDWRIERIILPDGRYGVVCYFYDLSERQRWEAAIRESEAKHRLLSESNQRLLESERVARTEAEEANRAKDRFLAVLSHELRTPLSPVVMTIPAIEKDPALPEKFREDLAMVRRNIELEVKLIDDLLDLSRVSSGKLRLHTQVVHVHELLRHALRSSNTDTWGKELDLRHRLDAANDRMTADPARLQQVFWNLLRNAVKFTPDGGVVSVRTWNEQDGRLVVEVSDTGVGIPPQMVTRIFDAFEQGDARMARQFGGLGLGLAIARTVVEMHGGTIHAASAGKDRGATFTVRLDTIPASDAPVAASPLAPGATSAESRPQRILLVEDHPDTARTLTRLLESSGYAVRTAHTAADALDLAAEHPFDLIISDIGLPDQTGYELMQQMRTRHAAQGVPVKGIALSGYGMEDDLRKSRDAGFLDHVVKPVDLSHLESVISRVLRDR